MNQTDVNEVVVEGLTPEDFILLLDIIENFPVKITSLNLENIKTLYNKISQIVSYLNNDE